MPDTPEIKPWADKLEQILKRAVTAADSGNMAQIVAAQKELARFKEDSPYYADALDNQASLAIYDLDLGVSADAVAGLKQRSAEVYRLAKLISGVADEAKANAGVLSGTKVIAAIDASTAVISSFKKLKADLSVDKPDEKAIAQEIDKVMAAVQALRNKLEK